MTDLLHAIASLASITAFVAVAIIWMGVLA